MADIGVPEILIILFILSFNGLLFVLPFWRIFSKAGFPGTLSLLMLLPIVNVIMLFYLAFAEWPSLPNRTK